MAARLLANRWIRTGLAIAVLGCGPLFAIIGLADLGLWPDSNPNPIGLGLLFAISVWPSIVCLGFGAYQVWRRKS